MSWEHVVVGLKPRQLFAFTFAMRNLDIFAKKVVDELERQGAEDDLSELSVGTMKEIREALDEDVKTIVATKVFDEGEFIFDATTMPPSNFEEGVAVARLNLRLNPAEGYSFRLEYDVKTRLVDLYKLVS